jgi:isoleucyl-tRNA synthetase
MNKEEEIYGEWIADNTFQKSIDLNENLPDFTFFDGPPFATGKPHYGHLLVGTIKDIVGRYKTMNKYCVRRNAGWDCHGLPIEMLSNKKLNITTKDDVMKLGIANYNDVCRKSVMGCAEDWKKIIGRTGRWIDFDNDYKTMDTPYMESVWWAFKELYNKGLVYQGLKVSPYSIGCGTTLSNSESTSNYKNIDGPSITIKFKVIEENEELEELENDYGNTYFLVWTTTPWTLFSNLALCCGTNIDMVEVLCEYDDEFDYEYLIMSKNKFEEINKNKNKETLYKIIREFKSVELKDLKYEPIFNYFTGNNKSYKVIIDDYVKDDTGTGIVHQSPTHGVDDFRVCLKNGIIEKNGDGIIMNIDDEGKMCGDSTAKYDEKYKGKFYDNCNSLIIDELECRDLLFDNAIIEHSYPHCWRTDTPLIYKSIKSWFINVEKITDRMVELAEDINWIPAHMGKKRFIPWLKNAHDWNVARSRYWGTPIPIWQNDQGETICIGSIDELYQLSGIKVTDLHRENIDHITIPSKLGNDNLKRIDEVFDCWFESGSMPYARCHYPFANKESFKITADFISESSDQIRCWFYNLHVLSVALFDKIAFKNVIVTGLILAEDGQKMSKSKQNYPDLMHVVNSYGADALRLYLIGSPVVKSENLCFKEDMVKQLSKDIIIPLQNTCVFYSENNNKNKDEDENENENNIMDDWILNLTTSFIMDLKLQLDNYCLDNITIRLRDFVDKLNNIYIKMNRTRFKSSNKPIGILNKVLHDISVAFAPIMPFCSEYIYKIIICKNKSKSKSKSVHLCEYPTFDKIKIEKINFDNDIDFMMDVVVAIRRIKSKCDNVSMKFPIKEVIICHNDLINVDKTREYIMEQCNIMEINVKKYDDYEIAHNITPNKASIGKKFKNKSKEVIKLANNLNLSKLSNSESIMLGEYMITKEDVNIDIYLKDIDDLKYKYEINGDSIIIVNMEVTEKMKDLYILRLFQRQIQDIRKDSGLRPWDEIKIYYSGSDELVRIVEENKEILSKTIEYKIEHNIDTNIQSIKNWNGQLETHNTNIYIVQL